MKKRESVKKLFNKSGLTYVELLVALALLALIVVCFTPMLLTSYESLYQAGEKTEAVYNSQQQMEEGLAVRSSTTLTDLSISFKKNAATVMEGINITGRKIVSSLQEGLETIFYGVRARIDIISSDTVNDDSLTHDVILQTTGLSYNYVKPASQYTGKLEDLPEDTILIDAYIPVKNQESGTTTDEVVYSKTRASLTNIEFNAAKGRINFTVGGADFTQSPVKILVYYKNERGYTKTLTAYLYIEPPTIIAGGTPGANDYYTTAGVQEVDISTDGENHQTQFVFTIEGRTMRLDNSGYLTASDSPKNSGTQINTITWVGQDENRLIKPYYVMAGTNGRVYRMYRYDAMDLTPATALGASYDVTNTNDAPYDLTDGRRVYQDFWSGEMADQYYFRTESDGNGYGTESDNKNDCSEETRYNAIDKNLRYLMIFSGYRTGYSYRMQASRRISYILTEAGAYSFRFGGKKANVDDFSGYTAVWEPSGEYYAGPGDDHTQGLSGAKWDVDPAWLSKRITAGSIGSPYEKPIYFSNFSGSLIFDSSENKHYERNIAWLGAISYTSIPIYELDSTTTLYNRMFGISDASNQGYFWPNKGDDSEYGGNGGTIENHLQTSVATKATITSAVYLEGAGSNGQGQVVYFGYVPAHTLVRQSSDIGKPDRYMYNGENIRDSRSTLYLIYSFGESGTNIYRHASSSSNNMGAVGDAMKGGANIQTVTDAATFFTKGNDDTTYLYSDPELRFTFGYCSRWRMAMGEVTSNGTVEATKSYENFYRLSHPTAGYDRVPAGGLNTGSTENLYYNLWFPGEHYNLTQTATCDEVTVACGYTVSGSCFMESSSVYSNFYGTALGSVYNDGIVAAYTSSGHTYTLDASKGGQTTIFQNVLYYKSPAFTNATLHSRANIRFEKIALNAETTKTSDTTGTKNYYAYFSDNYGKVYKALVATSTVTATGSGEDSSATENVTIRRVLDSELAANEVKVNGQSVNYYFSEITSIDAKEEIVIITGSPASGQGNMFLVATKDSAGNWQWKIVYYLRDLGSFPITAAFSVGGYYYIGVDAGEGYVAAISMETLRAAGDGSVLWAGQYDGETNTCRSTDVDHVLYVRTGDLIYAIGGRETN